VFWFLSVVAVVLGILSLKAGRAHAEKISRYWRAPIQGWCPKATVIVPVKGTEPGLRENLRALLRQDYPDFELLIVARDENDPALEEARPLISGEPGARARLIIAGVGPVDTGEKISNLLAAVQAAHPETEVLAFADSDGRPATGWLRALVAPLEDRSVGAATGYRWYFPEKGGFWPLVRSVWNSAIAGNFGAGEAPFAWGGAMAVRLGTFHNARIAEYWRGAVSDDYRLTQAVRAAGLAVLFSPGAMVETDGECSAREFFSWGIRQLTIVRVCDPKLFWLALGAHVVYCGAITTGCLALAGGHLWAAAVLLASVLPGMWRAHEREQAARLMFAGRAAWFECYGWAYFWLTPFVTWIWLYLLLASSFRRRIEWRGNTYELLSPSRTQFVK